jgi:hypothetical protein
MLYLRLTHNIHLPTLLYFQISISQSVIWTLVDPLSFKESVFLSGDGEFFGGFWLVWRAL